MRLKSDVAISYGPTDESPCAKSPQLSLAMASISPTRCLAFSVRSLLEIVLALSLATACWVQSAGLRRINQELDGLRGQIEMSQAAYHALYTARFDDAKAKKMLSFLEATGNCSVLKRTIDAEKEIDVLVFHRTNNGQLSYQTTFAVIVGPEEWIDSLAHNSSGWTDIHRPEIRKVGAKVEFLLHCESKQEQDSHSIKWDVTVNGFGTPVGVDSDGTSFIVNDVWRESQLQKAFLREFRN